MTESGVRKLRAAVIQQACIDYMRGCSKLKYEKFSRKEVERFMLSPEFDLYADDIDGKILLKALDKKVKDGENLNIILSH